MRDPPAGLVDPPEWLGTLVRTGAPFIAALLYVIVFVGLAIGLHPNTERYPLPRFLMPLRNWISQPMHDLRDCLRPRRAD